MKIAFVSPTFPPDHCGVGDHSGKLVPEWLATGHTVALWTAQSHPGRSLGAGAHHFISRPWNYSALTAMTQQIAEWKPDAVLIQFTPNLFAPEASGIRFSMPLWVEQLKARVKAPVALMAHELHYPLGFSPDRVALGIPQLAQFLDLAVRMDHVMFSCEIWLRRYQRLLPWRRDRLSWIPVGSAVSPVPFTPTGLKALTLEASVSERHRIMMHFGGSHMTHLLGHALAALEEVRREQGPDRATLVFAGSSQEKIDHALAQHGKMHLKPYAKGLGYLEESQVSGWLQRADLVLAPLMDGVSTRRSSVMAALAHGKAVVTTSAWSTDPSMGWEKFTALVPAKSETDFAQMTERLLRDSASARAAALGSRGKAFFEENFSWRVVAQRMVERLYR